MTCLLRKVWGDSASGLLKDAIRSLQLDDIASDERHRGAEAEPGHESFLSSSKYFPASRGLHDITLTIENAGVTWGPRTRIVARCLLLDTSRYYPRVAGASGGGRRPVNN